MQLAYGSFSAHVNAAIASPETCAVSSACNTGCCNYGAHKRTMHQLSSESAVEFFVVDFYPKPPYANEGLSDLSVRVVARDAEQAMQAARAELRLENPELDLDQFSIEVNPPFQI